MPRFAAVLLFLAAYALSADALHIIELRHRPAADIEPLVRPVLRADEALSATGYQLILRATESRRREIEKLVRSIDVAQRQLTITLRQGAAIHERNRHDSISGDVRIGSRGRATIGEGAPRNGIRYRGERRESTGSHANTQTLRVMDGQRAFIRTGYSVTAVEEVILLTGRGTALSARGLTTRDFTTGFDVLPRVRGDVVHLEITPRLAGPKEAEGLFAFHELQTTVTARLGEWVDLGSTAGSSSEVYRAILGGGRAESGESVSVSLKVE